MYANSRAHLLSRIVNQHRTGVSRIGDGYFDQTGMTVLVFRT
jgi:hypothetical protein